MATASGSRSSTSSAATSKPPRWSRPSSTRPSTAGDSKRAARSIRRDEKGRSETSAPLLFMSREVRLKSLRLGAAGSVAHGDDCVPLLEAFTVVVIVFRACDSLDAEAEHLEDLAVDTRGVSPASEVVIRVARQRLEASDALLCL